MQTHRGETQKQTRVRGVASTRATRGRTRSWALRDKEDAMGAGSPGEHVKNVGRLVADSFRPCSTSAGPHIIITIIITPRANPSPGQLAHAD